MRACENAGVASLTARERIGHYKCITISAAYKVNSCQSSSRKRIIIAVKCSGGVVLIGGLINPRRQAVSDGGHAV